jgi:hypothetical protein
MKEEVTRILTEIPTNLLRSVLDELVEKLKRWIELTREEVS